MDSDIINDELNRLNVMRQTFPECSDKLLLNTKYIALQSKEFFPEYDFTMKKSDDIKSMINMYYTTINLKISITQTTSWYEIMIILNKNKRISKEIEEKLKKEIKIHKQFCKECDEKILDKNDLHECPDHTICKDCCFVCFECQKKRICTCMILSDCMNCNAPLCEDCADKNNYTCSECIKKLNKKIEKKEIKIHKQFCKECDEKIIKKHNLHRYPFYDDNICLKCMKKHQNESSFWLMLLIILIIFSVIFPIFNF